MIIFSTSLRRFASLVAVMTLYFIACSGPYIHATSPIIRLSFTDGTHSNLELTDDLCFAFDGSQMIISSGLENLHSYNLLDVKKFTYQPSGPDIESSIEEVSAGMDPAIRLSHDGIAVVMSGGPHICRAYDAAGTLLFEEDSQNQCFIPAEKLQPGVIVLRIDHTYALKVEIR